MSPLASWALLLLIVLYGVRLWRWLARGPVPELRTPFAYWAPCPGTECARLLAPGERCPEHDVYAPLRTGSVRDDRA